MSEKPGTTAAPAQPQVIYVKSQDVPGQALAEAMAESATLRLDTTIPGGRYLAADGKTFIDADGQSIKGEKSDG